MINGLDLFSGIGGLTIALRPWVKPIAYCELEPYPQALLLQKISDGSLPNAPIWDDIRTLRGEMLPPVDIIYGGFPCQDISIAGAGAGLVGERSGLYIEIKRLVGEIRPKFIFLENVAAISYRGLEQISLDLTALGYDCRWTTLSAGQLGAPHLRERWWLLAYSNCERSPKPRSIEIKESKFKRSSGDTTFCLFQRDIWKKPPSEFCGVDDGIRPRIHRLKGLGNAVVPIQAREAFKKLIGGEICEKDSGDRGSAGLG